MRLLSFSIAEIMAIIALVALDCMAIRVGSVLTPFSLVLGGLPMQFVLMGGVLLVLRRRRRKERQRPFLVGFLVVGWFSHLIFVAVCVLAAPSLERHLVHTLTPVLAITGFRLGSTPDLICRIGVAMSYLTPFQLAPALIAGWISRVLPGGSSFASRPRLVQKNLEQNDTEATRG